VQVSLPTAASEVMTGRSQLHGFWERTGCFTFGVTIDAGEISGWVYTSPTSVTNPTALPFPTGVTHWLVAAPGGFHTLAVGNDSKLYCLGWKQLRTASAST